MGVFISMLHGSQSSDQDSGHDPDMKDFKEYRI